MVCPRCDHTMQQVSGPMIEKDNRVFWCPRCGTIKDVDGVSTPMLVGRVKGFVKQFGDDDDTIVQMLKQLGIIESIELSEQR